MKGTANIAFVAGPRNPGPAGGVAGELQTLVWRLQT